MAWISIKEYSVKHSISDSTIRRHIRSGKIKSKLVEGKWLLFSNGATQTEVNSSVFNGEHSAIAQSPRLEFPGIENFKNSDNTLSEVIGFSSKALNSYLMISDKLIKEHETRIKELDEIICFQKQKILELESYVKKLEESSMNLK